MAVHIRANRDIEGIDFSGVEIKLTQFADDTTYFLENIESVHPLLGFLDTFASWSGLSINRAKSAIMPICDPADLDFSVCCIPVVPKVKILGVWFMREYTIQDSYLLNFKPQLQRIKSICDSWALRTVSIKGKVTIVNSLLISLLHYPSSSIFTPPQVYGEYKKIVTHFLWNGKKPKVAYDTLTLPVSSGGLNLMDLTTRVKVSSLQWFGRLILHPASNVAVSLSHFLGTQDLTRFFTYKLGDSPPGISHDHFYQVLFKLWDTFHGYAPEDEDAIRRESIWGNKRITSAGLPLYNKRWESKGVRSIQDICHPSEPRLLSHDELRNKYDVHCSFLDMLSLRLNIPHLWKQSLSSDFTIQTDISVHSGVFISLPGEQPKDVLNVSPKQLYRAIVDLKNHRSTASIRWLEHPDETMRISGDDERRELCSNVYRSTRETKLQSLHFRIANRIVPCKKFLKQIRIVESDLCEFCSQQDTLIHFFYHCPLVKVLWASICGWFDRVEDLQMQELSAKQFLLGLPPHAPNSRKINAILMSVKFYVYRQRLFHLSQFDLLHWLCEFRIRLCVEREILARENRLTRFSTWRRIFHPLG